MKNILLAIIILTSTSINSLAEEVKYYEDLCSNNDFKACDRLAVFYLYGLDNVKQDIKKAKKIYLKACNGKVTSSCAILGEMYYKGNVINQDYSKAKKFFTEACLGKNPNSDSCFTLAQMYYQGIGIEKDLKKVKNPLTIACTNNHPEACFSLAKMYYDGTNIKQDKLKAEELWTKSCKHEYSDACFVLGEIYLEKKNHKKAIKFYHNATKNDDFSHPYAYFQLGVMYYTGTGVDKNMKSAIKYFTESCIAGVQQGCHNAKILESESK
jgi:TPR repeat protein